MGGLLLLTLLTGQGLGSFSLSHFMFVSFVLSCVQIVRHSHMYMYIFSRGYDNTIKDTHLSCMNACTRFQRSIWRNGP